MGAVLSDERTIRDKVCIIGIGETEFTKAGGIERPEFRLALEAITAACDDAGLEIDQLNGFSSYADDRNTGVRVANALGIPQFNFTSMVWGGGGGGGSAAIGNAAAAIAAGYADYIVVYRALAQGQFGRFGDARGGGGRMRGPMMWDTAFGIMAPAPWYAAQARRHMHEYGTTSEQFGHISVASYKHAQSNPRAMMYGRPITLEDHQNSRMIADPLHLYDCCQTSDGAAAAILAPADRAGDFKQKPVYISAVAQGSGPRQLMGLGANWRPDYTTANFTTVAERLFRQAGMGPEDIDVAQFYENFTPMVLMSIEDHGFCKRGEAGAWVEGGRIEHKDVADAGAPHAGELPINTSGGNLAEGYIHGMSLINEAVRQARGTSTMQVEGVETSLVASGPGPAPVSDLILHN